MMDIAAQIEAGDLITLSGDLGAGKTTLARSIIRAALDDAAAEVPSPTFSLAQHYAADRCLITHFDFYRLTSAADAEEIGLDEAIANGAVLIEWPDRASGALPADRLDIALTEIGDGAARRLDCTGSGPWRARIARLAEIHAFILSAGCGAANVRRQPGDASTRRYLRLSTAGGAQLMLMDAPRQPDGPPIRNGLPYSRIAHLAEDVRPFVAIARHLRGLGLSAPEILAHDLDRGLLLLEHLGDAVYGDELARGADQTSLWRAAVDALLVLRRAPVPAELPVAPGIVHRVPPHDRDAMQIEVELLIDWYAPALTGQPSSASSRSQFLEAWQAVFDRILQLPTALILRDFHSPNLLNLSDRSGAGRTGIIDFQDALIGHPSYDLVSLLQDARLDVPPEIEQHLLADYLTRAAAAEPGFDRAAFEFAYRALGAQRNTKILGIFTRLARRDGKSGYLRHIPRIWRYLERDLQHDGLQSLRAWYDRELPHERRGTQPVI